jgi:hypothetical protein
VGWHRLRGRDRIIDNVSSSSIYKNASWTLLQEQPGSPNTWYDITGYGFWNGDTNAITGLELTTTGSGGGNITSGT